MADRRNPPRVNETRAILTRLTNHLPLAIGAGEGAEMLQPLAITIVFGLSFSMLVTLVFMPVLYSVLGVPDHDPVPVAA